MVIGDAPYRSLPRKRESSFIPHVFLFHPNPLRWASNGASNSSPIYRLRISWDRLLNLPSQSRIPLSPTSFLPGCLPGVVLRSGLPAIVAAVSPSDGYSVVCCVGLFPLLIQILRGKMATALSVLS